MSLVFQSTLPVGGATIHIIDRPSPVQISIHAPRGGSDCVDTDTSTLLDIISIHAPRGGSDSKDAQFYLRIFGEKVNFECYFLVNSRYQPIP